jgi:hypothetical protein
MMFLLQLVMMPVIVSGAAWLINELPGKAAERWQRYRRLRRREAASGQKTAAYLA